MTTTQLLTEARRLVAQGWCQGSFALDALDKPVSAIDPDARRFDLEGALQSATRNVGPPAYEDALGLVQAAVGMAGYPSVMEFNDAPGRTQAEVVALIDSALAAVHQVAVAA